jgi:hypothetical protein
MEETCCKNGRLFLSIIRADAVILGDQKKDGKMRSIFKVKRKGLNGPKP